MTRFGIIFAVMVYAGAMWAEPSILLERVRQRYPWNNLVDIDYTVSGVPSGLESEYYVRIKATVEGETHVLREFLDDGALRNASNGIWRVTWNCEWEDSGLRFNTTNATVDAELVHCGADRSNDPYFDLFAIVDLTKGVSASASDRYPVEYRHCRDLVEATNTFNTAEYKTTKLVLRRVRAGTFMMGSPTDEAGRESTSYMNRETRHQVTLTRNFLLGIFPVTQAQYLLVMGTNPSIAHNSGGGDASLEPVNAMSYQTLRGSSDGCAVPPDFGRFDADSFMGKLSARTGLTFDLPTEAQWEYACRAGTSTSTYADGVSLTLDDICWYDANCGYASANVVSLAVGQKAPNAWGFYDMLGNAWEWCRDRVTYATDSTKDNFGYDRDVTDIPPLTDPLRDVSGGMVALRGGSFASGATVVRSAIRNGNTSVSENSDTLGFRLSAMLPE